MTDMTTNPAKPEVAGATRAMFPTSATAPLMLRGLTVAYAPEDDAGAVVPDDAEDAELDADDTDQDEDGAGGDDPDADDGEDNSEPDDDTEEVEHEGAKYRIPKALKPALMFQADYTKKTQALSEDRRAVQARAQAIEAEAEQRNQTWGELRGASLKVAQIEDDLAVYDKVTPEQWHHMFENDRAQYDEYRLDQQRLKDELPKAQEALKAKEGELTRQREETRAKQGQELGRALAEAIPDFNKEKLHQIAGFAVDQLGVSPEELADILDPRVWKTFYRAMDAETRAKALEAELSKVKTQKQTTDRHKASQSTTPAKTVSNKGQFKAGLNDDLPAEEWTRRRNAQIAKRNGR